VEDDMQAIFNLARDVVFHRQLCLCAEIARYFNRLGEHDDQFHGIERARWILAIMPIVMVAARTFCAGRGRLTTADTVGGLKFICQRLLAGHRCGY